MNRKMKVYLTLFILVSLTLCDCRKVFSISELNIFYDQYEVLQSINYVVYSISKIVSYNDRVILTNEYENIINNLNFDVINDRKIITLLTDLMDVLTEEIITARQKERITNRYKKLIERALFDSIKNNIINININPANLTSAVASTIVSAGSIYINYQNCIEDYKDAMNDINAELEDHRIKYLNNMRSSLLEISWEMLKNYNINDKYRLTEKQAQEFIEAVKIKTPDLRYRTMKRLLQDNPAFQEFPEFWYQYGLAAKLSNAINSPHELMNIFYKYDRTYKNLFRHNPTYAAVAMERIMLRPENSDKNKEDLEIILKNSTNEDWQNYLFAGIKYLELGEIDKARDLFQRNIDNGHEVSLNARLLSDTYISADISYKRLLEKILADNRVSNADKLYMIGKSRDIYYLNKFKDQIKAIQVSAIKSRNPFNSSPLYLVQIPVDWFLEEGPFVVSLNTGEKEYELTCESLHDDRITIDQKTKSVQIEFGNDSIISPSDKPKESIRLSLRHPLIDLELTYIRNNTKDSQDLKNNIKKAVKYVPLIKSTLATYEQTKIKYLDNEYYWHDGNFEIVE